MVTNMPCRSTSVAKTTTVLLLESLVVAIASSLLSISGIPTIASANTLYIPTAHSSVQVDLGATDWMSFTLLDFFYVFSIWTYMAAKGRSVSTRTYIALGLGAFPVIVLANGLKIFAQIYTAVTSTSGSPLDATTIASTDATGFGVMFGIILAMVTGTCVWLSRGAQAHFGTSYGPKNSPFTMP